MSVLTRREFLGRAAGAAGALALGACSRGPRERVVRFFNWSNYIGKTTLAGFEKETGIRVQYEMFGDEEEMFSKLRAGVSGYDLIVCTDYMIPRLKALRLVDPVPQGLLRNLGNIAERFRDPVYDPGLAHTVPYLWGTTGIGFNSARLKRAPSSWRDLWDERYKGRISMLDNTRDCIGVALLLLGLPSDTKSPEHLARARDLLVKQRPVLKRYSSTTYVDELASGELWLSQAWSGDVMQVARENKSIDYAIPKEGSFIYVDSLAFIHGSSNREDTLRFVDYLLRPDVAAEVANTVRYATPNAKAVPLLDESLRAEPRIFPPREVESRLRFHATLDPDADELWSRTWQEVKVL